MAKLTALQSRILHVLAEIEPRWTLTGGAALVGLYLGHRKTRDLDLFWHGLAELGGLIAAVRDRLVAAGFEASVVTRDISFAQIRVDDGSDECVVDLVAEPVPAVDAPSNLPFEGLEISVDTPHEILVNKLSALLGRSEIRDLQDVRALLHEGGDLERAVEDAPKKDGGFSPMMLVWILGHFSVEKLAREARLPPEEVQQLLSFRDQLVDRLGRFIAPGAPPAF